MKASLLRSEIFEIAPSSPRSPRAPVSDQQMAEKIPWLKVQTVRGCDKSLRYHPQAVVKGNVFVLLSSYEVRRAMWTGTSFPLFDQNSQTLSILALLLAVGRRRLEVQRGDSVKALKD
ncbi:unnamed protein product [Polarella glacialis]|uniref:Uncharacterized protein n=1 Tax=Polarella glacialis TaxID=89957 RepID=A0A813JJU3_POLGL|nr:unnamed protein product [Polarella glacialis]